MDSGFFFSNNLKMILFVFVFTKSKVGVHTYIKIIRKFDVNNSHILIPVCVICVSVCEKVWSVYTNFVCKKSFEQIYILCICLHLSHYLYYVYAGFGKLKKNQSFSISVEKLSFIRVYNRALLRILLIPTYLFYENTINLALNLSVLELFLL